MPGRFSLSRLSLLIFAGLMMLALASCGSVSSSGGPGGGGNGGGGAAQPAKYVYVAMFPGGGPTVFTVDQSSGLLTQVKTQQQNGEPWDNGIAADAAANILYTATTGGEPGAKQNGLWGHTVDMSTGQWTTVAGSPFGSSDGYFSVAVDPAGKFLYAAMGMHLDSFSIGSDGALTQVASAAANSNENFGPQLVIAPNGQFLYSVARAQSIVGFSLNNGSLTALPAAANVGPKCCVGSAVITPDSKFLYAPQSDGTVLGFSIGSHGELTALAGSPFPNMGTGTVVISPDGKFLYTAQDVATINSDGSLSSPSATNGLVGTFDPTGKWLYMPWADTNCFHCDMGVAVASVDPASGVPTMVKNSRIILTNSEIGSVGGVVTLPTAPFSSAVHE